MSKTHSTLIRCTLVAVVLLVATATQLFAQRTVYVPRGHGTLNAIISSDSLNRLQDPSTVYMLQRGDFSTKPPDSNYVLTATITNWGATPLRIASYGTGPLPRILPGLLPNATSVTPSFNATNDLYLSGVYITARDVINAPNNRIIVTGAVGIHIVLDSCWANQAMQSTVRAQHDNLRIYLTNSTFSNMNGDFGNGRVVDNRGILIDTLFMQNCSIYRTIRRVYRGSSGVLNYGFFDHNTFDEISMDVFNMTTVHTVTFQNNLFADCGYLGNETLISADTADAASFRNNIFYADTAKQRASWPDTVEQPVWYSNNLMNFIRTNGDSATNIMSPVTFTMSPNQLPKNSKGRPVSTDSIARWYWTDPTINSGAVTNLPQVDSIQLINLAYNTDAPAYTFADGGQPVGCTFYFAGGVSDVRQTGHGLVPVRAELDQNYPNPFNPTTVVSFQLPVASNVKIVVYDILGREVKVLVNESKPAGTYSIRFDASALASGTYLYRLTAGSYTETRRMILMK